MKPRLFLILLLSVAGSLSAEPLACHVGPIHITLGGTKWQVTSCSDGQSLVFATMKENPAMPFAFVIQRNGQTSKIHGEGDGSKEHSSAAFEELKTMTEGNYDELVKATQLADREDDA